MCITSPMTKLLCNRTFPDFKTSVIKISSLKQCNLSFEPRASFISLLLKKKKYCVLMAYVKSSSDTAQPLQHHQLPQAQTNPSSFQRVPLLWSYLYSWLWFGLLSFFNNQTTEFRQTCIKSVCVIEIHKSLLIIRLEAHQLRFKRASLLVCKFTQTQELVQDINVFP